MRAMVLAAGRGERMRPLTDSVPKPLLRVGGETLIGHHLRALARAGVHEVVVNLSWLGEQIRAVLADGRDYGVHVQYSEEGAVPLETGGGIYQALPLLGPGPFLVVNGDIWTDFDLKTLALDAAADARLVLAPNPPHHPRGDFGLDGEQVIERSSERPSYTYTGIGIYRPEFFAGCSAGRFPLLPLLRRALEACRLHGECYRGEWHDVGSPERLAELDARLRGRD